MTFSGPRGYSVAVPARLLEYFIVFVIACALFNASSDAGRKGPGVSTNTPVNRGDNEEDLEVQNAGWLFSCGVAPNVSSVTPGCRHRQPVGPLSYR